MPRADWRARSRVVPFRKRQRPVGMPTGRCIRCEWTTAMRTSPQSHRWELNPRPLDYESSALPLSYCGDLLLMPWRGFEPRRLAAPPPQDGVSTSFTTRATQNCCRCVGASVGMCLSAAPHLPTFSPTHLLYPTGPTGLEPATSRVTVECSNQTELRPLTHNRGSVMHAAITDPISLHRVSPRSCSRSPVPASASPHTHDIGSCHPARATRVSGPSG